jgi:hypothetical protein
MFSRCWVQILAIYEFVMNQIICLSNLLSGRFIQKRAMCTKLDIYVSVFYGQPTYKTDSRDIAEILLKVMLTAINLTLTPNS